MHRGEQYDHEMTESEKGKGVKRKGKQIKERSFVRETDVNEGKWKTKKEKESGRDVLPFIVCLQAIACDRPIILYHPLLVIDQ